MRKFWLMDRHGSDGPTALVQTDGSLHIVDVLRFGPTLSQLEDQQRIWDEVIGRVAPTLKPCLSATDVDEVGVEPLPELQRHAHGAGRGPSRAGRQDDPQAAGRAGRPAGGPSRSRPRGER